MTRNEKRAIIGVTGIVAVGCLFWLVGREMLENQARHVAEPPTASRPSHPATAQAGALQDSRRSSSETGGGGQ